MQSDLPFLPERVKINKCSKLVCNLYDKKNNAVHLKALKEALNHGLEGKQYSLEKNLTYSLQKFTNMFLPLEITFSFFKPQKCIFFQLTSQNRP